MLKREGCFSGKYVVKGKMVKRERGGKEGRRW